MRALRLAAVGATALALALPAIAHAGTVSLGASAISFQATAPTKEVVEVGIDAGVAFVTSDQGVTSGGSCNEPDPNRVECSPRPAFILSFLGFEDSLVADLAGAATVEAHGGGGGDSLSGSPNADKLYGDDGDDRILGQGGNDLIDGGVGGDNLLDGPGDDTATGGPGDDSLENDVGRDTFAGGDGYDRADYTGRSAPVTITLDGVADDGEAGEADNMGTDVEYAFGGAGNDRIALGPHDGGASGGSGNDTITGSPGQDRLTGEEGDDVIDSRDGGYDSIDCGPGNDTILADLGDDASNCEVAPDRDGDGYPNEGDCAPDDPAVHPGAGEVFGNAIDEDCVGGPNFLRVDAGLTYKTIARKSPPGIRWKKLKVVALDEGDQVQVRCRGKGCAFKKATRDAVAGRPAIDLTSLFKKRYLLKGASVEIRVVHEGQIGIVRVLKVVKGPKVKETRRCLPPGSTTPGPCPAT